MSKERFDFYSIHPKTEAEKIPDNLKSIFGKKIYANSHKGAGFRAFNLIDISVPKIGNHCLLTIESTSKKIRRRIRVIKYEKDGEITLIPNFTTYFFDIAQWFYDSANNIRVLGWENEKDYEQFWFEYDNIKNKYPEYFL